MDEGQWAILVLGLLTLVCLPFCTSRISRAFRANPENQVQVPVPDERQNLAPNQHFFLSNIQEHLQSLHATNNQSLVQNGIQTQSGHCPDGPSKPRGGLQLQNRSRSQSHPHPRSRPFSPKSSHSRSLSDTGWLSMTHQSPQMRT